MLENCPDPNPAYLGKVKKINKEDKMSKKKPKKLNKNLEKKIFDATFPLLIHLVAADGKLHDAEEEMLKEFALAIAEEGISPHEISAFLDRTDEIINNGTELYIENAKKLLTGEEKKETLEILILASLVDEDVDPSEAMLLQDVAEAFKLDLEKVIDEVLED